MENFEIEITGAMPLLMHWDNIDWSDKLDAWRMDPSNKKYSKAGDDRTPAWRWIGTMYHDGEHIAMPSENLMRCLMEGGAMVPVPGGKGGKTFKSQTQSGIVIPDAFWPMIIDGKPVQFAPIEKLLTVEDFAKHREAVKNAGFSLFVKRAKIGQQKHVRVRPRFDRWALKGRVTVFDEQITRHVLADILAQAGRYKGLGDWRPGSKTPGPFGMFDAKIIN